MKKRKIIFFVIACIAVYLLLPVTFKVMNRCDDYQRCVNLVSSEETEPTYKFFIGLLTDSEHFRFIDDPAFDTNTSQNLVTNAVAELIAAVVVIFVSKDLKKKRDLL